MGWVSNPGAAVGQANTWTAAQTISATGKAALVFSDTTTTTGLTIGGDTTLFRTSANILSTDAYFTAAAALYANRGAATNVVVGYDGIAAGAAAAISFGSVNGDANLRRGGAAQLITDGSLQATTGIVPTTAVSVNNYVAGQAPATSTQGTDTTPVSGTIFFGQVFIPANVTLTGISYLIGTVGGTNSVIVGLYNNAGTLVKNSALGGTVVGTLATMQRVPFTSSYAATGPAMYWVSVSMNGTTARLRTHTFGDHAAGSATGVFGTLGAVVPVTSFTANTAPYAMTY